MERQYRRRGWVVFLAVAIFATLVGVFAYNAGVTQGIAQAGQAAGAPGMFVPYGWHRPWGFGFFFPFLFFGLWFLALRGLFWGGGWRHHRCYGGGYYDLPPAFDEWHRRAHERMTKEPAGPPNDDDRSRR